MDLRFLQEATLFGNEPVRWLLALTTAALVAFASRRGARAAKGWAVRRSEGAYALVDDLVTTWVRQVQPLLIWTIAIWAGSHLLALPQGAANAIGLAATLALFWQVGVWGNAAIQVAVRRARADDTVDPGRKTTFAALVFLSRLVLYAILILLALENVGIDITALLAGIGIASIAIGLALQNILGDLFASLSIVFDKPFEIGDFVIVDDMMGTIEHVGLRTTRVRSLSGEQLVFANNDLLTSRIRNYKRMQERRVAFRFGVTYDTPAATLRIVPERVREIVAARDLVRFDRAHFFGFGDFSLDFEVVYWVLRPDYALYMDVQQEINLALVEAFEELGVQFAFPTRTIHLAPTSGSRLEPAPDAGERDRSRDLPGGGPT
ncbi:MAG: mechanosensitive ion channel family protein [Trueperaceae bacterium]